MELAFGKYKGKQIGEVPLSYLTWLIEQPWLTENIRLNERVYSELAARLKVSVSKNGNALTPIYREMAKKYHPDKGGSNEAFQAINDFYQQLRNAKI